MKDFERVFLEDLRGFLGGWERLGFFGRVSGGLSEGFFL